MNGFVWFLTAWMLSPFVLLIVALLLEAVVLMLVAICNIRCWFNPNPPDSRQDQSEPPKWFRFTENNSSSEQDPLEPTRQNLLTHRIAAWL